MDNKKTLQRVLLHLVKTKQTFCFGTSGQLYTLEDVLGKLQGRKVQPEEAYQLLQH